MIDVDRTTTIYLIIDNENTKIHRFEIIHMYIILTYVVHSIYLVKMVDVVLLWEFNLKLISIYNF